MNDPIQMRLPCVGGTFEDYKTSPAPVCIEIVSRYDGVATERLIDEVDGLHLIAALVQMHSGRETIQLLNLTEFGDPAAQIEATGHAVVDRLRGVMASPFADVREVLTGVLATWPDAMSGRDPQLLAAKSLALWLTEGVGLRYSPRAIHVALDAPKANRFDDAGDVLWWIAATVNCSAPAFTLITAPTLRIIRFARPTQLTAAEIRSIRTCGLNDTSEHRDNYTQGFSLRTMKVGSGGIDTGSSDYREVLLFSILQAAATHLMSGRDA